jgi:hypothetical protein
MNIQRLLGLVLLVAGIALAVVGVSASDSLADQASEFFTGKFTDKTMWYIVGGGLMGLAGLVMLAAGGRRAGA